MTQDEIANNYHHRITAKFLGSRKACEKLPWPPSMQHVLIGASLLTSKARTPQTLHYKDTQLGILVAYKPPWDLGA